MKGRRWTDEASVPIGEKSKDGYCSPFVLATALANEWRRKFL